MNDAFARIRKSAIALYHDIVISFYDARRATLYAVFGIMFAFAYFICEPFLTIWSLNTVFKLEIPYSFQSWVAMVWLVILIKSLMSPNKKTPRNV